MYSSRAVSLGAGSQVVVAVDPTSKIVMLGFSASDASLQQMLQPVTTLSPLTFLSTMFQNGPPEVHPWLHVCGPCHACLLACLLE